MWKQRMVNDSFWTDTYIEDLDPSEKLIFLYLLTNPLCNIAWIYEIKIKRIAYETWFDKDMVEKILNRFVRDGKILKVDDWILLKNFWKNQSTNPNVLKGMQRIIDELPEKVKALKGFESLSHFTLLNLTIPNGIYISEKKFSENSSKGKSETEDFSDYEKIEEQNKELEEELTEQESEKSSAAAEKKSEEVVKKKQITVDIDNLISEIKTICDELDVAYNKTYDRRFAKHIITASEFWDFAQKIGLSRTELAKNILLASEKINFWKWICSGPMTIYQNYAEVYNTFKQLQKKQKSQALVSNKKKWIITV